MTLRHALASFTIAVALAALVAVPARAQVGTGLLDANTATAQELTAIPHLTPAIVDALVEARPFAGIVELHAFLLGRGLSAEQAAEVYRRTFIHVNLNTGTAEEIQLIPGAGRRMAREFAEYRPWQNWTHFDREIGKYVDQAEVNRLKMYVFIPIDLNTASDEDIPPRDC